MALIGSLCFEYMRMSKVKFRDIYSKIISIKIWFYGVKSMETKTKSEDNKFKFAYEDSSAKFNSTHNQLITIITKSYFDFYSKLYEDIAQNMVNYYMETTKLYEKYIDMNSPKIGKIPDSPDVLPANGHDIYNYVARYGIGNYQIQAIMKLDSILDFDKLSKAVRLSVDEELVLGCRFVEGNPPYWKRLENIDEVVFCTFEEVVDVNEAVQKFLDSPLNMDTDPMVKVKLIRSGQYDTLCIKLNHACCDATGTKEYIQLLSEIYSSLGLEDGMFTPTPKGRSRKDQDRLFRELGIEEPDSAWIPGSDISITTWAFPWNQGVFSTATNNLALRFAPGQLDQMKSYAKLRGNTINNLILAALYRAMLSMGPTAYGLPMQIPITVDLRRYLPDHKTEGIRNFSGSVNTWLSMVENESFDDTLSRAGCMMNEVKNGFPGVQSAIGLERLEKISFQETLAYYQAASKIDKKISHCPAHWGDKCVPTLANMGIISESLIKFGNSTVTDAFLTAPIVSTPGLLLVASTYNGILTLGAGFFENTVAREDVEKLLNCIKSELLEGCKCE